MKVCKYLCFLLILFSVACQKEYLATDLVQHIKLPENGLLKKKQFGEIVVEAQYKPLSYIIANEIQSNQIDKKVFDKRYEELKGLQYLNLKITTSSTNEHNITNYNVFSDAAQQDRLYYLSYRMKEDIVLIEGEREIPCALYHFERSYDIAKHRTFVLAFERTAFTETEDKTLVLDTPVLNTGPIKIKFKAEDINNIPPLKLTK